jgi:carbonic anhydrase/acetyltransferase-like protein (isoleucine patch superfamily)
MITVFLIFDSCLPSSGGPEYVPVSTQQNRGKITLVFSLSQGYANDVVALNDQLALQNILGALAPLQTSSYDVALLVNPMGDKANLQAVLDTITSAGFSFVFDAYSSDTFTLGACSTQNDPFDVTHGISINPSDLAFYRQRYGSRFSGLRVFEVFGLDFTVDAIRTTNPGWAQPCWKFPSDSFYQQNLAQPFLSFASSNNMFVQWGDFHWNSWDPNQSARDRSLMSLISSFPGVVTVTYDNNEPNGKSLPRNDPGNPGTFWLNSVSGFAQGGNATTGLSDQAWLCAHENSCPVSLMIKWAATDLILGNRYIQFEPDDYYFNYPHGVTRSKLSQSQSIPDSLRGTATRNLIALETFLGTKCSPSDYYANPVGLVASGAVIYPCATVEVGATISSSAVIESGATVGVGAVIDVNVVVGPQASIGDGAIIEGGAWIDHNAQVGAGSFVRAGTHVLPNTVIPPGTIY